MIKFNSSLRQPTILSLFVVLMSESVAQVSFIMNDRPLVGTGYGTEEPTQHNYS